MKRFVLVLAVAALMAVMLVAIAAPAFAAGPPFNPIDELACPNSQFRVGGPFLDVCEPVLPG